MIPSLAKRHYLEFGQTQVKKPHSDKPTSMIGLRQEGKDSPDALGRRAGKSSSRFSARRVGLSAWVPLDREPDIHLLSSRSKSGLGQKIEFVLSC